MSNIMKKYLEKALIEKEDVKNSFSSSNAQKMYHQAFRKLMEGLDEIDVYLRKYFESNGYKKEFSTLNSKIKTTENAISSLETNISGLVINIDKMRNNK